MIKLRDITEFLSPKKQEELREIYGQNVSEWKNVKTWDDLVTKEEKALINKLRAQNLKKCPFLKKKNNYFYFCNVRAKKLSELYESTEKPKPNSVEYLAKVNYLELQFYCFQLEKKYSECLNFKGAR